MRGQFYSGLLFQFDLSDAQKHFSSYYFFLRNTMNYKSFDLDISCVISQCFKGSFAFSGEAGWQTGFLLDRLSLGLRWSSGEGSKTAAFFPVTRETQGVVLRHWFSGLMTVRAKYEIRLMPSLSAYLGGRYFIRTDDVTFYDQYLENDSYFLGTEFDAGAVWVPFSDLSFSFVGGVFIPQPGGAFSDKAPVRFSLTLGAIFSF
jgi:hypothetical protein